MRITKDVIKEYITITAATLLVAVGIYFFKFPNQFSTGGVSGISVILGALFPRWSNSAYMMIINILMLVVGMILLGKVFCVKTIYCSIVLSVAVYVMGIICPMDKPLTTQPFLELTYSIFFPAIGSAILFYYNASTGGTDIAAMILKKYTGINIGNALFVTDFIIAVCAGLIFGIQTGLFSLLGLFAKSLVVINETLHKGATVCTCTGAYSNNSYKLILTAVNRAQAQDLKKYVKSMDKHSFVVITNSFDIIGKGFREYI